jgi:hypothetical protein
MAFQANEPGGSKRGYKKPRGVPDSTNKKQPRKSTHIVKMPRSQPGVKAVPMPRARKVRFKGNPST